MKIPFKDGIYCETCGSDTFVRRTIKDESCVKRIRICKQCKTKKVTREK